MGITRAKVGGVHCGPFISLAAQTGRGTVKNNGGVSRGRQPTVVRHLCRAEMRLSLSLRTTGEYPAIALLQPATTYKRKANAGWLPVVLTCQISDKAAHALPIVTDLAFAAAVRLAARK